ncbi:MAG: nitroreductase [Pseudohongiellaceae bacterium]
MLECVLVFWHHALHFHNPDQYMDALSALLNRTSVPKLTEPGPGSTQLQAICQSAFRAADHGVLRPWRFLMIQGESRRRLGELFAQATRADNPAAPAEDLQRASEKALRAPLILVTIACPKENAKVPALEQEYSAAAATQNMLLAAFAQGIGAIWRTGPMALHPLVRNGLGLDNSEKIISFLYLGTVDGATRKLSEPPVQDFFRSW